MASDSRFARQFIVTRCNGAQQFLVPAGVLGNPIIGDDERPALRLGQMIEHDDRHLGHAEPPSGEQPAMSRDDNIIPADQDRIHETEFGDRSGDLRDLIVRVRPSVLGAAAEFRP